STVPGLGPRHLAYAKDGNTAYLAYELGNVVSVLRAQDAGWVCVQTLSTLPEQAQGESSVAAVRVTDTQVMVSNRGHDSIAVFERLPDGLLRRTHIAAVPGKFPRDFALLDDGRMLVAQQDAGGVAYLQWTGDRLTPCCAPLPIAGAVCVCLG
ncbi:MAG: beta-propeller fold lactonase family protein, partial [Clostridia bacterium]